MNSGPCEAVRAAQSDKSKMEALHHADRLKAERATARMAGWMDDKELNNSKVQCHLRWQKMG